MTTDPSSGFRYEISLSPDGRSLERKLLVPPEYAQPGQVIEFSNGTSWRLNDELKWEQTTNSTVEFVVDLLAQAGEVADTGSITIIRALAYLLTRCPEMTVRSFATHILARGMPWPVELVNARHKLGLSFENFTGAAPNVSVTVNPTIQLAPVETEETHIQRDSAGFMTSATKTRHRTLAEPA